MNIASGTHSRTLFPADSTLGAFLQKGTLEIKPGVRHRQYNLRVTSVDCAALLDPTPLSLFRANSPDTRSTRYPSLH